MPRLNVDYGLVAAIGTLHLSAFPTPPCVITPHQPNYAAASLVAFPKCWRHWQQPSPSLLARLDSSSMLRARRGEWSSTLEPVAHRPDCGIPHLASPRQIQCLDLDLGLPDPAGPFGVRPTAIGAINSFQGAWLGYGKIGDAMEAWHG